MTPNFTRECRSRLCWLTRKWARRAHRYVCRHIYRDKFNDVSRCILVAGAGRSGTTWLAELIASQMRCRIMFEPFNSELVQDFSAFNYFLYMRPQQQDDALLDYVRRVLSGAIRHPWIDRQVNTIRPQYRLVKGIRSCLFLRWIHDRFPEVPTIFIIRHPCAVVASRLRLSWATDGDIRHFTSQSTLVADFLADKLDIIREARTDEEKHAIVWCVSNLVPLEQMRGSPMHLVFYEDLACNSTQEIPRLFHHIGRSYDDSVFDLVNRPSMTTQRVRVLEANDPVTSWQQELSSAQIGRVLGIVRKFGLDHLYGESALPKSS